MSTTRWLLWIALLLLFNGINTLNSRGKNSRSLLYNGLTTLMASLLYIASIAGVGNELLLAKASHKPELIAVVMGLYAVCSAVGSMVGQIVALRWERGNGKG